MKLLSVSVPNIRGLYSVHVMSLFKLGFYLIAVSMIGCFADEYADGTPQYEPC